jgi:hypothetical protein
MIYLLKRYNEEAMEPKVHVDNEIESGMGV